HRAPQLLGREGLGEVTVGAEGEPPFAVPLRGLGRDEEHPRLAVLVTLPNEAHQLQPVDVRHVDVADHQLVGPPREQAQGVEARRRLHDVDGAQPRGGVLQSRAHERPHAERVFYDQNSLHRQILCSQSSRIAIPQGSATLAPMAPRLALLPRVCVIGAGCSGLTSVKALRAAGIPHTCFEMSDRVGGNWVFGNKNGRSGAYRSLHINTSRQRMEYGDFPMPDDLPDFPHHRHVAAYFESYARRFDLYESIRFEHEVLSCRPLAAPDEDESGGTAAREGDLLDAGGWSVTVRDLTTGT